MDGTGNRAVANRGNPTEPEIRLWRHLSNRQLDKLKFRRQHRVDGRILDFFCPSLALAVEIDGRTHDPDEDRIRDDYLYQQNGITVIRFSNIDVMTSMEGALSSISATASRLPQRWKAGGVLHPNPSCEEEGLST